MPAGEAIDGITGEIVMSSAPDLYEHAGVYVYTCLLNEGFLISQPFCFSYFIIFLLNLRAYYLPQCC